MNDTTNGIETRLREHDDPRLYHEVDVLMSVAADHIASQETRIAELKAARDNVILHAQCHAGESRCQHSIVIDTLKALGLPENDWEATKLIVAHVRNLEALQSGFLATIAELQAQLAQQDGAQPVGVVDPHYAFVEFCEIHGYRSSDFDTQTMLQLAFDAGRNSCMVSVDDCPIVRPASEPTPEAIVKASLEAADKACGDGYISGLSLDECMDAIRALDHATIIQAAKEGK